MIVAITRTRKGSATLLYTSRWGNIGGETVAFFLAGSVPSGASFVKRY